MFSVVFTPKISSGVIKAQFFRSSSSFLIRCCCKESTGTAGAGRLLFGLL